MSQHPLRLILRALKLWLSGRVRRRSDLAGFDRVDQGEPFKAFRRVEVAPGPGRNAEPTGTFCVRFRFKNLSARVNRLISLIPIPLIVAQPGFRSKTWLLGERTGDFMGFYEFDTIEAARAYWDSLPLGMMRRRAEEGSLVHDARPTGKRPAVDGFGSPVVGLSNTAI